MLRSHINFLRTSPKKPRNRGIRECVPLSEDLIISDKKTQKYLYTHEQKTQKFCYTCVSLPTKNPEILLYVGKKPRNIGIRIHLASQIFYSVVCSSCTIFALAQQSHLINQLIVQTISFTSIT